MVWGFLVMGVLLLSCHTAARCGQEKQKESEPPEAAKIEKRPPQISRSTHNITIEDNQYRYTAVAGEMLIEPDTDKAQGRIFYVSYELEGDKGRQRPLTFAFNGGPGAASVWLHLGGLGPKRIMLSDNGQPLPPPVRYGNNAYTWLSFTDLVFVDPVGTGFSRSGPAEDKKDNKGKAFYGVEQDIKAVAEFIRLYLNENDRWMSPKFLVGESYGTTRAAGLTQRLHERYGIDLNAILLISPVLDFKTILFSASSDLPYVLFLPTYSATAWHYGGLPKRLQQKSLAEVLKEVEAFCSKDYLVLLAQGDRLTKEDQDRLSEKLSSFTGLPEEAIRKHRFRIDWMVFTKSLLQDKERIVGRMDSTATGVSPEPAEPRPAYDPSLDRLYGPMSSAMNAYVREELGFDTDLFYEFLNPEVTKEWDWSSGLTGRQGFVDLSHTLKEIMTIRSDMRVFIACGLFDLATPYLASQHTLNHMWLADARSNVVTKQYQAGHMIYLHHKALKKLYSDAKAFYTQAAR